VKRQAARRKYHFIYKTTCIITGRWYIGMHSTDDLGDGYLGSGKQLWNSIQKHGKKAHICEVLEFCENRILLRERERMIVSSDVVCHEDCMNLVEGGRDCAKILLHTDDFKQKMSQTLIVSLVSP